MTREELNKRIELVQAQNREALERVAAHRRKYDPLMAIHSATTDLLLEDLREAIQRLRDRKR